MENEIIAREINAIKSGNKRWKQIRHGKPAGLEEFALRF